jgi:flagellar biosynthetic protein FlhB
MADNAPDKESKTEEPTEKKLRDSVEQGRTPVSHEASIFASMMALLIAFGFLTVDNAQRLVATLRRPLDDPGGLALSNGTDAIMLAVAVGTEVGRFVLPIVLVLAAAGIASSFLQNAPQIVLERIKPDPTRLSIVKNWRRIFSAQGQAEFFKSVFKFFAISLVLAIILKNEQPTISLAMSSDPAALPEMILTIAMRLVSAISIATIVLVAVDLVWVRIHWRRDLRMTRQELKDEYKQVEGDPLVKARLRSLARDRSRRRMLAAVPRASMVIANPTHYSIALKYVRGEDPAPIVLAKGKDLVALKIREIATEHGIPIIEDRALARALYDVVEIDRLIPQEFYRAVAEIIFFLHGRKETATP